MPEWRAEIAVGEELARALIGAQFPEVAFGRLRLLAEGWDNTVWLVGERWVFRFPRRTIALPGVERELAVLPRIAPLLPVAVPCPVFVGRPSDDYPWPFFGSELIRGREASDAELTAEQRLRLAPQLGAFLRTLHSLEVDVELPEDFNRRADMARRVPRAREYLGRVEELGLWSVPVAVERLLEEALRLPAPPATALVHGDLHVRHLLVDEQGALSGVIDWGDVCRADPSIDLSLYWSLLPPEARSEFLAAYGDAREEQFLRARVLALFLCAALAVYARDVGLRALERESVAGLATSAAP